jgi:hypothetical protein
MPDNSLFKALLPEVEMKGEGSVTPPPQEVRAMSQDEERYQLHYKEFRDRGISAAESERLARAVVARDDPKNAEKANRLAPLKLDADEAKRLGITPHGEQLADPKKQK